MTKELIFTIIGSAAFFSFIQFLISRHDNKKNNLNAMHERFDEVDSRINAIYEQMNENEAKRARSMILRFGDELYVGGMHTKEHFDDILEVCTAYNSYCDTHPDFKNKRTEHAQKRIEEVYDKCVKNHLFLDGND